MTPKVLLDRTILNVSNQPLPESEFKKKKSCRSILSKNSIFYNVPNDTTRLEIEKEIISIQNFIRKELKNNLKLIISVDKNIRKKFKYTTTEKYNALKDKNPKVEKIKNIFKLSI